MTLHVQEENHCSSWIILHVVRTILNVTFGAIVGENKGAVQNCCSAAKLTCSGSEPYARVSDRYGYAHAYTLFYFGVVVGYGTGDVTDCVFTGSATLNGDTHNNYSESGIFYGYSGKSWIIIYEI